MAWGKKKKAHAVIRSFFFASAEDTSAIPFLVLENDIFSHFLNKKYYLLLIINYYFLNGRRFLQTNEITVGNKKTREIYYILG